MTVTRCRVCSSAFFPVPSLVYGNMPKAAQCLPRAADLSGDAGADLTLWQCSGCGLSQLDGEPVPYYREVIRAAAVSAEIRESKTAQLSRFVERFGLAGRRVVEIGCGRGEFLSLLAGTGVEAYGLEHSEAAVAECTGRGLRVARGYVESEGQPLPGGPFDAFLLLMFLEHMPDPNGALRGIRGSLAEGAVGLVEVPNYDMVLREGLFSEFIADHLLYFTEETLRFTLTRNGFEVLSCEALRDGYVLSAVVARRARRDLAHFQEVQLRLRGELEAFVSRFGERRVAVWGAGHQALAVLALAGLGGRIRYVVDSAPFKQGAFTPATHVPIVPPDTLASDPVDAVIVMAASYSDEVARILRTRFPGRFALAILRGTRLEIAG